MPQQDVAAMHVAYDAFNRADMPAALAAFDPQIEWVEPGGGNAPCGTFEGTAGVGDGVFATIPTYFDEFRAEPDRFIDAGDHLVVVGHFRGRAKGGRPVEVPFAHVWIIGGEKPTRFRNFAQAEAWEDAWEGR